MLQTASSTSLGEQLKAGQHQIDVLLLQQSHLMAAFVESDEWEEDGSATPYDWIRINCHLTSNAVYDRATVGEKASELVESVQAMEATSSACTTGMQSIPTAMPETNSRSTRSGTFR
ncbi:MAG: hypothetical protein E6I50_10360 [Chloroflexi bacterium]|nr:MAG: hypothetical protein E6I50_10360 [Chloroflexota bacterium]